MIPIGTIPVPPSEVSPQACTFDQAINNKLHKNLVTKLALPKQAQLMPAPLVATLLSIRTTLKLADKALSTEQTKRILLLGDDGVIVMGTRHKKRILQKYKCKFGNGNDAIFHQKER